MYTCYTYGVYVHVYTCNTCRGMCLCIHVIHIGYMCIHVIHVGYMSVYTCYTCGVYVHVYVPEYGGQGSASEQ